jgi:collagenase-like PrtC family protease
MVDKISKDYVYESYAARIYRQRLDEMYAQRIVDKRQKASKEEKDVEVSRLNRYNEEQRVARNQRIYKHFKDMELYLFKCRELQLQENRNIQLGTKIDLYC